LWLKFRQYPNAFRKELRKPKKNLRIAPEEIRNVHLQDTSRKRYHLETICPFANRPVSGDNVVISSLSFLREVFKAVGVRTISKRKIQSVDKKL
jgi:hypothetical protein